MNVDGTLLASVEAIQHCVHIYRIDSTGETIGHPIIVGSKGVRGKAHGQFSYPHFVCFVRHELTDTLLICDSWNHRVVEVTASGAFVRAIDLHERSGPHGVAYCAKSDVIAVSLWRANTVVLLQYDSGAVKTIIGNGTAGSADGQLNCPLGVTFTKDGDCILVADSKNYRVSTFSAATGAFIAHMPAFGIPRDVLHLEDGSILVVVDGKDWAARLVHTMVDAVRGEEEEQTIIVSDIFEKVVNPKSLCVSTLFDGVIVKCWSGALQLLRDGWPHTRGAWLCAVCLE